MIYLHVPFCRSFCTYCGFYSEIPQCDAVFGNFSRALRNEIRSRASEITDDTDTLYIGGGTPSVLPLSVLSDIVSELRECGFSGFGEFTVEVNPDDVVSRGREFAEGLRRLGVNRVSMGVQSFDDRVLKWMNRRHSAADAVSAYRLLRTCGIDNISVDLIFGLGDVSGDAAWRETIEKTLSISGCGELPRHISAYQLSVEEDSALASMEETGRWRAGTDEQCGMQYEILCGMLVSEGYMHYEISNFALPGYEAVHNSAYWRHVPYAGFGPGAHSFVISGGRHIRKWNNPDLQAYIGAYCGDGDCDGVSGSEILTAEQIALERIMLGLRTSQGVAGECIAPHKLESMLSRGLLEPCPGSGYVRIPEKHFFISDNIISDII